MSETTKLMARIEQVDTTLDDVLSVARDALNRLSRVESERDALAAQLTEVTRERNDALQANLTWRERHEADVTGRVDAERERDEANARMHAAESALALLRAVVEQMVKDLADGDLSDCCYGGSCVSSDVEKRLKKALLALPADPSAPTPR